MNPNKQQKIQEEFDRRLLGLCAEFSRRLGVVSVASTMVVHAAKFTAQLGEQFAEVAEAKWKSVTAEFRDEIKAPAEATDTK
jgi:hypothetical protein